MHALIFAAAVSLATAETNLQLCREEASVTGEDADALCERRQKELEEAQRQHPVHDEPAEVDHV